jgi:hypothetical protein
MLTIWSLNGARFSGSSRDDIPSTLKWLQGLSTPGAAPPDILCLQDFRVSLLRYLSPLPYFHFVPLTNAFYFGERELLGICIASRWPIDQIDVVNSWGDGTVRDLEGVDQTNERSGPLDLSDRLVLQTQNRVALACTVLAPAVPGGLRVATHHGFWTRDGAVTDNQLASTRIVSSFLTEQAKTHGGLIYMADYNPDKFGKVHRLYCESGGLDCLPNTIQTTLAEDHPAAKLGIKSDCVMTWPSVDGLRPRVGSVALDSTPGSDHMLLRAEVWPAANRNQLQSVENLCPLP